MGNAKRTILVHIWDDPEAPNGIQFGMSGFGVQKDEITCAKGSLPKADSNSVTFEINNRSNRNWLFPTDESDAMWVSDNGTDCPTCRPPENPEFPVKDMKVSHDREQLAVRNRNSSKAMYKFALNFVDGDDQKHLYSFDPIWNNQNGGSSRNR
jgi:hypothetical protein